MSDDTVRPPSKKRPKVQPKILALAGVAVMTLILAALMFTLSFDALRALAIEIGAQPQKAWMAPVAIDIAQAAATLGLVAIGVADKFKHARWYCMALATVTVLLSVAGNAYHAYGLSLQNIARVAAGEDIGFIPQPPVVAATIAAIFPLLWLALLHLFTIMLRVIMDERAQPQPDTAAMHVELPAIAQPATRNRTKNADETLAEHPVMEPRLAELTTVIPAPVAHDDTEPATRPAEDPNLSATTDAATVTPAPAAAAVASQERAPEAATRNGWPQTTTGLHQFLATSNLTEQVKEVATIRIDEPDLNQVQVAQRLHVDKSTVCRRWKAFVVAAEREGFTVPPLPRPMPTDIETVRELQPA